MLMMYLLVQTPVAVPALYALQVDPLRRFYSSLHEQIPESDMAMKWRASSCTPTSTQLGPGLLPNIWFLLSG